MDGATTAAGVAAAKAASRSGPVRTRSSSSWRRYALAVAVGDGAGLTAGVLAVRHDLTAVPGGPATVVVGGIAFWILALGTLRAYEPSVAGTGMAEYARVVRAALQLLVGTAAAAFFFHVDLAPATLAVAAVVTTASTLAVRALAAASLRRQRATGRFVERLLVVGTEPAVLSALRHLARTARRGGSAVVGACFPGADTVVEVSGIRVRTSAAVDDVLAFAQSVAAESVVVTGDASEALASLRRLAWQLEGSGLRLFLAADTADLHRPRLALRHGSDLPLLEYAHPEFHGWRRLMKEVVDRIGAGVAAAVLAPVFAAIALLILVADGRPVLFRQERVGKGGRRFDMWKFRTMVVNAEDLRVDLLARNEVDGLRFKIQRDPRVTGIGRFLRRWSLDELPQVWNVLTGHMSLVGPRPPLPAEVENYCDVTHRRLLVKPGITGLWQVSGRSSLTWEESLRLDLEYVQNWSPTLDTGILARTVMAVLRGRGAY